MIRTGRRIGWLVALACSVGAAQAGPVAPATAGCNRPNQRCLVEVTLTAGTCEAVTLTPATVAVSKHDRRKLYRLVWRLPQDFVFKPAMGDGVFIKDEDQGEFSGGGLSSNDSGTAVGGGSGRRWRWEYRNAVDGLYHYKIQFRNKQTNQIHVCDPVISNLDAG